MAADLLILAHGASWEMRFQISSLAASAAAVGQRVDIALFFGALAAWAQDRWDDLDPSAALAGELARADLPPLSGMLAPGRDEGRLRLYACSASARLLGLDFGLVQTRVDAILGWQSFAAMIADAHRVVTL